jgi:hypothetical protein
MIRTKSRSAPAAGASSRNGARRPSGAGLAARSGTRLTVEAAA